MENISVTRGLAELGVLGKRISDKINKFQALATCIGKKPPVGFKDREEFEDQAKADYTSIQDLIKRRDVIKTRIVESNAVTKVRIGDKEMTVAEAIEKKTSIQFQQQLFDNLKFQFGDKNTRIERANIDVADRIQRSFEVNLGKDGAKIKPEDYANISKPILEENEWKLIDPLDIKKVIEKIETEIEEFKLNVDFSLSESNAKTEINLG